MLGCAKLFHILTYLHHTYIKCDINKSSSRLCRSCVKKKLNCLNFIPNYCDHQRLEGNSNPEPTDPRSERKIWIQQSHFQY